MDIASWWLFWFYIGLSSVYTSGSSSGCVSRVQKDAQFIKCLGEFQDFVDNTEGVGGPNGVRFFCRPELSSRTECLIQHAEACPAIFPAIHLPPLEEIKGMCPDSNITHSYCKEKLSDCDAIMNSDPNNLNGLTPFSQFQRHIGIICSPVKFNDFVRCKERYMTECRDINNHDLAIADIYTMTEFAKSDCGHIPHDFSTNECVRTHIDSGDFMLCYQDVFKKYGQTSCEYVTSYAAGKECLRLNIGVPCGQQYSRVFFDTTHLFIKDVPTGCEPLVVKGTPINVRSPQENPETTRIAPSAENPFGNGACFINAKSYMFLLFIINVFMSFS